ncbi:MAG TPA: single-stranded DNA-binding protein [Bacteroidales bacterium]|nr:MAG: Single-stranded DNA-binding protein [Bacteroidetes bacterium ADurb.Bin217]HPH15711.1 single-stranded DNA-binding protein [Bacteroidales bacterium]HPM12981.1 single-stranded DNA-binding protein [Bacteroidales bacterium]
MINKVILVGNVGADPEIRYISDGVSTGKIKLATSETYLDKNKERVTKTEWHNIVVWNALAKTAETYVKKGMQLYIEGKISTRSYEKDGETKYFTEIIASEMKFLGRKAEGSSQGEARVAAQVAEPEMPPIDLSPEPADDLPF